MAERNFDVTNRAGTSKKQMYSGVVNLEENCLMPSLQHASMSKVAIALWNKADIKYRIVKYFNKCEDYGRRRSFNDNPHGDEFLQIVDKVLENLLQLHLPNRVSKMLSNIVHPLGNEIFDWINYQDSVFHNPDFRKEKSIAINYIDDLVWTPRGIIDYKETAKVLLAKGGILCDLYKYNIACEYCLEDDIPIIAPKVINTTLNLNYFSRQAMLYFWTARITGDFTKLIQAVSDYNRINHANYSTNECIFKVLIANGPNEVAIKYIWDELSPEEQSRQRASAIANTYNNDFRFFLLSQISKEQENEVFNESRASKILLNILGDWLWGHCFLPTVHNIWHIMSELDYLLVLDGIVIKMENSHEDISKRNEYKATFKEVWKWAPKHLKDHVFEENNSFGHYIFFRLFDKKNIDIIQSILLDLNDVQKKIIIFSDLSRGCKLQNVITSNQLDLLEWLIERTLSCREDVECFKRSLLNEIGQEIALHFIQEKECNKVQQLLKWACISDNDINNFKNQLMINDMMDLPLRCYDGEVIRWFNPSIETMIRFKEKFRNYWSFKYILPVLDEYAQEQLKIKL